MCSIAVYFQSVVVMHTAALVLPCLATIGLAEQTIREESGATLSPTESIATLLFATNPVTGFPGVHSARAKVHPKMAFSSHPPVVEAVAERPTRSLQRIGREILLGAQTMLAYHHVTMAASFVTRCAFALLLRMAPQASLDAAVALFNMRVLRSRSVFHALEYQFKALAFLLMDFHRLNFAAISQLVRTDPWRLLHLLHQTESAKSDLLSTVLIGPTMEELAYRGCAQGGAFALLSRVGVGSSSALLSRIFGAILFGLAHVSAVDGAMSLAVNLQKGCGVFISSMLIESRLAQRRRSVWAAVGAHSAFNFVAMTLPTTRIINSYGLRLLTNEHPALVFSCADVYLVWLLHRWLLRRILALLGEEPKAVPCDVDSERSNP